VLELTYRDRVAMVTLSRPDKRNALNVELCHRLGAVVTEAVADGARALVLTGAGTSFCSGADLAEVYTPEFRDALYAMLHTVTEAPVPVVAAVNGPAIGAGTQLAIAADLRVVSPGAVFGVPTARIGLAVDPWTIRRLALLAGNGTARSMLLSCAQLDGQAALRAGLADRVAGVEDALDWAAEMAELAPLTIAYSKRALNELFEPKLEDRKELDEAFEGCWTSADFAEGRRARAEKRPPVFEGR
jgi:enoyl-CoA hydratase